MSDCACSAGGLVSPVPIQSITLKQGADATVNLVFPGATPPDITGYAFEFVARAYVSDPSPELHFGTINTSPDSRIAITDGPNGKYALIFVNANTSELVPSQCGAPSLLYDVKATAPDGTITYTVQGYVYVSASINIGG